MLTFPPSIYSFFLPIGQYLPSAFISHSNYYSPAHSSFKLIPHLHNMLFSYLLSSYIYIFLIPSILHHHIAPLHASSNHYSQIHSFTPHLVYLPHLSDQPHTDPSLTSTLHLTPPIPHHSLTSRLTTLLLASPLSLPLPRAKTPLLRPLISASPSSSAAISNRGKGRRM